MNESVDTIAAVVTPFGVGGIGVIRVSGSHALSIVSSFFSGPSLIDAPTHTLHHGFIQEKENIIDEVIISIFRRPRSYTGEDVVEISCHGSPAVLKQVLSLCLTSGARMARPGEFTERAYVHGKMDLAQAEAVASLIQANSNAARRQAAEQLRGSLSNRIKAIREELIGALAHMEANLDFVEDDIPALERPGLISRLQLQQMELHNLLSTSVRGRVLREGLKTVLIGRPNAGKSSLFNALLASDRAIVTDIPGTTRDTLEEKLEWEGVPVILIDTAGLRQTTDRIEEQGLARMQSAKQQADVLLYVIDAGSAPSEEDKANMQLLDRTKTVVVLNKMDMGKQVDPQDVRQWGAETIVTVSALRAQGLDSIRRAVVTLASPDTSVTEGQVIVTQQRHVDLLEKSAAHLGKALMSLTGGTAEEAVALELREAVGNLSAITGESVMDDMLAKIFSTFCIGK